MPGEIYTFSVVLCDNEVDRDYERFTIPALKRLAALYLGKTGIFDHNPKGENQTARIFDAEVVTDPQKTTKAGEPYTMLKASAYMVRSKKNEELILEIDAGIKKEVSVGCSVASVTCSVCGTDLKKGNCGHQRGKRYGGSCCHEMCIRDSCCFACSAVRPEMRSNWSIWLFLITSASLSFSSAAFSFC